ncbi:MAG: hypothetical protein NC398_07060 [Acetatifactor muris]|nr:hypothetical protein [Acetatifactor muris]MCM1525696.1 hypothetical protein [Bacteroides sp.]
MKKLSKTVIGLIVIVILTVTVIVVIGTGGSGLADGTYRVTNCESYPDAYIVVDGKGSNIRFYNIDLNEIYREDDLANYNKMLEKGFPVVIEGEELEKLSDLNEMFVSHAWTLEDELFKKGTFTYGVYCMGPENIFGLVLEYDSLHKTIQIMDEDSSKNYIFKKAWFG